VINNRFNKKVLTLLIAGVMLSSPLLAADEDKTGTNPIAFSHDIRAYNEFSWLNTEGDGTSNLTTLEFRTPFMDGKWQFRARTRYNIVNIDPGDDGLGAVDDSGMGDTDMRFLTVLNMNMETKQAWAAGLEVFLDTASEDSLGSGTTSLGPQIFFVQFLEGGLFAPGLQYQISVDEDDGRSKNNKFVIDLNYLKMADDKQSWFFADPQIVIDIENDVELAIIDFEFGWMMTSWFKKMKGQSFYIRPSIGVGQYRGADGSVEVGYKYIGW
jgi:hypothetical protein